ncbi:MAG: hypothetical protein O2832_02100 [Proteobacteria bacterium]|nr:hypothetical protein [Pseudomonadota bacterium]
MTHARTQIRNVVKALLLNNTSAGAKVYESRIYPLDDPKLPAILIYTKQESVGDQMSMSKPRTQHRELQLTIEVYVKANSTIDETADGLALEIEQIIGNDLSLGGLAKDTILSTTEIQYSDEGEKPIAVITLTFAVLYAVKENAPQTLI